MSFLVKIFALISFGSLAYERDSCYDRKKLYQFNYLKDCKGSCYSNGHEPFTPCRPSHCYVDRVQRHSTDERNISIPNVQSVEDCSKRCCTSDQCNCRSFFWSDRTRKCVIYFNSPDPSNMDHFDDSLLCTLKNIPDGYQKGDRGDYFKLYNEKASWEEAVSTCASDGGQLVPDKDEKHEELIKMFQGRTYWIAVRERDLGHQDSTNYVWVYEGMEGGEVSSLWDNGEPPFVLFRFAVGDRCAYMGNSGRWRSSSCSDRKPFVCEILGVTMEKEDEGDGPVPIAVIVVISIFPIVFISCCVCACVLHKRQMVIRRRFLHANNEQLQTARVVEVAPLESYPSTQNQLYPTNQIEMIGGPTQGVLPVQTQPVLQGQYQPIQTGQPPYAPTDMGPVNPQRMYTSNYPVQGTPYPPPSFLPPNNYPTAGLPPPPAYSTVGETTGNNQM